MVTEADVTAPEVESTSHTKAFEIAETFAEVGHSTTNPSADIWLTLI